MSVGLQLFEDLCTVGNALATFRDTFAPGSDNWTAATCLLLTLDQSIDLLVRSEGLVCDTEEET